MASAETSHGTSVAAGRDGAVYVGGSTGRGRLRPRTRRGAPLGGDVRAAGSSSSSTPPAPSAGSVPSTTVIDALTAIARRRRHRHRPASGALRDAPHADGGGIWSFRSGGARPPRPHRSRRARPASLVAGTSSGTVDIDPGPTVDLVYGDIAVRVALYLLIGRPTRISVTVAGPARRLFEVSGGRDRRRADAALLPGRRDRLRPDLRPLRAPRCCRS